MVVELKKKAGAIFLAPAAQFVSVGIGRSFTKGQSSMLRELSRTTSNARRSNGGDSGAPKDRQMEL